MYDGPAQKYVREEIMPPTSTDWEHKPSQFKLYRNCAQLPLPYSYDLSQTYRNPSLALSGLEQVGELLAGSYGLMQQCYAPLIPAAGMAPLSELSSLFLRRPVPSGGALFPCEIYFFSEAGYHLPTGIYHYDVAHHALDILQQRDAIEAVRSCLAHPGATRPTYIIALSCFFWKDSFKYGEFSYRLQGFDLGAIIAQYVAILNQQILQATVHYQFLDTHIDALLGLDPQHESVYALISIDSNNIDANVAQQVPLTAGEIQEQEMPSAPQSISIARWPLAEEVHQASLITTREQFQALDCLPTLLPPLATASYALPPVDEEPTLLSGYSRRYSAQGRFIPTRITPHQLARFCRFSSAGYDNDLDERAATLQHTLLYCVINRVKDIPQGIYCYDPRKHTLEQVVAGDMRAELQAIQWSYLYNMFDLSVCFFPVGNYTAGFQHFSDRWYRIQNMEAGMIVQRLYLTAAALQLGCRASLGFSQQSAHTFLRMPEGWHALIQIMIAPEASPYGYYQLPIHP